MSKLTYQQRGNQSTRIPVNQRSTAGAKVLEDNRATFGAKQLKQGEIARDKFSDQAPPVQQEEQPAKPNNTGLPDKLKSGIEALSGVSMENVKVHYNSAKPQQLNALAYAQGTDIHVGSGQEQHLPHEAWHVVQQAQGRVRPTMQMMGSVPINDDKGLEAEANVEGRKALQMCSKTCSVKPTSVSPSYISTSLESNDTSVTQLMKYTSGINSTFKEQPTSMSCWAACIAAIKNIEISEVIGKYNHGWESTGLPPDQDMNVLASDYGLMKYTPWQTAFTTFKHLGMVANNGHWIVVFGVETDDGEPEKVVSLYTFDPETNQKQWYTIDEMNQWGASAAYA
ncbi:MAG: DUF4157 domain-containing protein [Methylococcaceae bacterium]